MSDSKLVVYPDWICFPCGEKYGRKQVGIATWHVGTCDVCGQTDAVTEPRDFGHLKKNWRELKGQGDK